MGIRDSLILGHIACTLYVKKKFTSLFDIVISTLCPSLFKLYKFRVNNGELQTFRIIISNCLIAINEVKRKF